MHLVALELASALKRGRFVKIELWGRKNAYICGCLQLITVTREGSERLQIMLSMEMQPN